MSSNQSPSGGERPGAAPPAGSTPNPRPRLDSIRPRATPTRAPTNPALRPKAIQRPAKKPTTTTTTGAGSTSGGTSAGGSGSYVKREPGSNEAAGLAARMRNSDGRRPGGRGRFDVPMTATGAFSMGPAGNAGQRITAKDRASIAERAAAADRSGEPLGEREHATSTTTTTAAAGDAGPAKSSKAIRARTGKTSAVKPDWDDLPEKDDDTGRAMRDMTKMREGADPRWEPITLKREEKAHGVTRMPVAKPGSAGKLVRVQKGPDVVKDEDGDVEMKDDAAVGADSDEDLLLPTGVEPIVAAADTRKKRRSSVRRAGIVREVEMTPEQLEEHERHMYDLSILRESIDAGEGRDGSLMFFQLPDVLPMWKPHVDTSEAAEVKEEQPKPEPANSPPSKKKSSKTKGKEKEVEKKDEDDVQVTGTTPAKNTTKPKKKKGKPVDFPPPEGLLGTLNVHRSGRVTCDWGGVRCEVSVGSHADVLQEATHLDPTTGAAVVLGSVGHRLVLTPDLDALLRREKHDRKLQQQAEAIKLEADDSMVMSTDVPEPAPTTTKRRARKSN